MTSNRKSRRRRSSLPENSGDLFGHKTGQDRKVFQLCAQAERALVCAFGQSREPLVLDLQVHAVQPCPSASRLLVLVQPVAKAGAVNRGEILDALGREKGRLRTAVAQTVNRKRAPDLLFELAPPMEEVAPWE